jgi:hypothetical protein
MSETEREQQSEESIPLRINWHIPDNLQSRYANNVIVQAGQHEIIINFFEIQIPPLVGTPEENKEQLQQIGTIRAEGVGRIIVSPELLPTIIDALENGLKAYQASKRGG